MNAWLLRPYPHKHKRLTEFKNNNMIAIGWPCIGDLTGKSRKDIKTILSENPYNLSGPQLGSAYGTVDIFVNKMNLGDIVVIPDGNDIYFCMITSGYYLNSKADNDADGYAHQRKIMWLTSTTRSALSPALRSSLKVRRTTANLSKHKDEICTLAKVKECVQSNSILPIYVVIPLRDNFNISFTLPSDITRAEAKRLSEYFETLYFE